MTISLCVKSLIMTQNVVLDLEPHSTFHQVKFHIFQQEGIPIFSQRLLFGGQTLSDSQTLAQAGIESDASLTLLLKAWPTELKSFLRENLSSRVFTLQLDVGGREFKTTLATMAKYSTSALGVLAAHALSPENKENITHFFLDADPDRFNHVLAYLSRLDWDELGSCNLAGSDLTEANVSGSILPNDMQNVNLSKVNLAQHDLRHRNLTAADVSGAKLPADLSNVNLSRVSLKKRDMREHKLQNANLTGVNVVGTLLCTSKPNSHCPENVSKLFDGVWCWYSFRAQGR
jgi:hypothetical protein